ncbi:ABC transporter ATP-binding protein [Kribbella sp. GL6]|uniref:ABC transporter ATP-binding protein n=1 Tax=Kribbella sp. GL6 TaxID=3419765 RepID=UPI003D086178
MPGIRLDSVSKVFDGRHLAVDGVSLDIARGECMVLLGPSGCGKTTLLRMIAGLEVPTEGTLWFGRTEITDLPPKERGVALVFQNGALYPHRTARENILFPLRMAAEDAAEADAKVTGVANILGIDETLDRFPKTLSGGERQRVAIGRALVRKPRVFLMDEPLSNLDATMRTELRQEIGAMVRDLDVTTVYVTHDQVEALTLADRIAIMRNGRIEDVGTSEQIFHDPATAFTAGFLGVPRINLMSATVRVTDHHRVSLDFGNQSISLPPIDRRSLILVDHDGERVIVGARSHAFTTAASGEANQLTGALRALEFHGSEWMAFVQADIELINPDLVGRTTRTTTPEHGGGRSRHANAAARGSGLSTLIPGVRQVQDKLLRRRRPHPSTPHPTTASHRRADLVIELNDARGLRPGTKVHLTVDTERLHIFDESGHRIDRITR